MIASHVNFCCRVSMSNTSFNIKEYPFPAFQEHNQSPGFLFSKQWLCHYKHVYFTLWLVSVYHISSSTGPGLYSLQWSSPLAFIWGWPQIEAWSLLFFCFLLFRNVANCLVSCFRNNGYVVISMSTLGSGCRVCITFPGIQARASISFSEVFSRPLYMGPATNQGLAFNIFVSMEREGENPWHTSPSPQAGPHTSHHRYAIPDILNV